MNSVYCGKEGLCHQTNERRTIRKPDTHSGEDGTWEESLDMRREGGREREHSVNTKSLQHLTPVVKKT